MDEPKITFYQSKKPLKSPQPTMPIDQVVPRTCKFRNLVDYMAKLIGPHAQAQVKALKAEKKFSLLNDIHHNIELCELLIKEYIKSNGNLKNYHSFNYIINDGEIVLNDEIIIPFQDR